MGLYKLIRQKPKDSGIRGTIESYDEDCVTGEEIANQTVAHTLENTRFLIPAGQYRIVVSESPKFGTLMPLITRVPGRTGIRIHFGSKPQHSRGCVLVTRRAEYVALLEKLLKEQNNYEPIYLNIVQL